MADSLALLATVDFGDSADPHDWTRWGRALNDAELESLSSSDVDDLAPVLGLVFGVSTVALERGGALVDLFDAWRIAINAGARTVGEAFEVLGPEGREFIERALHVLGPINISTDSPVSA